MKQKVKNYIKFYRYGRLVSSASVLCLAVLAFGILVPYYIKTNNSEATAGQAIGSTLTFSAESLTASVSLSNLDKDGTFATSGSDEQAEFSIATDNFTGYTLTMRSTSGNTLSGSEGNTDTFTSIQSNISASTFSNSANTSYNNQWGIIPNYYYSNNATIANTDTYLKVPATNESITLDVTSAKNAEAKNYTIGIGARADYTNKIDTYSNTFILEYIANPVTYSITYNKNTTDTVNNMPATNPQTGSTSGGTVNSVNLTSNIPTRTGYTFKGWCSVSTSDDTCSGTIYNDQTVEAANRIMNYGIDQTIDNTMVTLNAMWTRNNATYSLTLDANGGTNAPTVSSITNNSGSATFTLPTTIPTYEGYNFLGWCGAATSDNTCSGTTYSYDESTTSFSPSTITLTQTNLAISTISSSLYAIWELAAKTDISQLETMQDFASLTAEEYVAVLGSMTEGQSYQLKDSRDDKTYNIAKLKGGNVWLQDNLQLDIAANKDNITSTNTNANNDALTCLKSGCNSSTTYSKVAAANTNASTWSGDISYTQAMYNIDNANYDASYGNGTHKSGYYYNYCAASAGSYCYAKSSAPSNTNATQDICPVGWQMPAGDTSIYSYQKLYEAYGSDYVAFKNALHAGLSGRFSGGISSQGSYGYFWASTYYNTYYNNNNMFLLYVGASSVNPQDGNNRYNGCSVRCVLNPSGLDTNITFSPNGADSGSATTLTLASGSDSLPYDTFTKSGYRIASWNTAADGSGTSYAVNTPVTVDMDGLTLYAQWTTGTWMQGLAYNSCTTTAKTVYDVRDGKAYTVQRLKLTTSDDNGLCWMLDNLQLDIAANKDNISSANTNANNDVLTCLKSGCSSSTTYSRAAAANTNASSWRGDKRHTQAMYNIDNANYDASYGNGTHKSGYYYNYCAATAGSYCYHSSSGNNGNASQDICPAGWKMPAGDSSTYSYQKLYEAYGSNAANFKNALHAGLSGNFNDGINKQGSGGYFWASTRYNSLSMRNLYVDGSSVNPQNYNGNEYGFSVRCVLKATS